VFAQKEQEVLEEWKRQYQVERKNEMEAGMEECTRNPFNGQKTSRESTHRTEDLAEKCTKNPFNGQKTSRESTHRPEDLMENVQKTPSTARRPPGSPLIGQKTSWKMYKKTPSTARRPLGSPLIGQKTSWKNLLRGKGSVRCLTFTHDKRNGATQNNDCRPCQSIKKIIAQCRVVTLFEHVTTHDRCSIVFSFLSGAPHGTIMVKHGIYSGNVQQVKLTLLT